MNRHPTPDQTPRNLGTQPLAAILSEQNVKSADLVAASTEQLTFKMISRACKGRRLTPNVKAKIQHALSRCTGTEYALSDLFNY